MGKSWVWESKRPSQNTGIHIVWLSGTFNFYMFFLAKLLIVPPFILQSVLIGVTNDMATFLQNYPFLPWEPGVCWSSPSLCFTVYTTVWAVPMLENERSKRSRLPSASESRHLIHRSHNYSSPCRKQPSFVHMVMKRHVKDENIVRWKVEQIYLWRRWPSITRTWLGDCWPGWQTHLALYVTIFQ